MSTRPATEAVFTTWPSPPWASMRGTNDRTPWTTPMRLMPSVHCQSSRVAVQAGPPTATPALLKTRCTAPKRSHARAASKSTSGAFETSQRKDSQRTPSFATSSAVSRIPFSSMSASATAMASRAHATASSRPMPLPAPVTTAVLPFRSRTRRLQLGGHAARPHLVAQPFQGLPPELVAAARVEEPEMADGRFPELRRRQVAAVDSRAPVKGVQLVRGPLVDHGVVGERVAQDGCVEPRHLRAPRLALGEKVAAVQAPAAPLVRDPPREVAHHAQSLAGEVTEERREDRE